MRELKSLRRHLLFECQPPERRKSHSPQPLLSQPLQQLDTNHSLSEAEDLSVIAQDTPLDTVAVVGGDGSNSSDLVGSDGDSQSSPTDEDSSVSLSVGDHGSGFDGDVGVWSLVGGGGNSNVGEDGDSRILLESDLEQVLVVGSSFIGSENETVGRGGHLGWKEES